MKRLQILMTIGLVVFPLASNATDLFRDEKPIQDERRGK